jgi:tRNA nucleotidyltransferase (CCA-adding enzyme)
VAYGVSLEEDLARRDFTINAIAYHPLRREWRDPFGGAVDLAQGCVRAVGEPADRFREDYLRILRALRFAARFDFRIEPRTWDAARAATPGLPRLSAERVRDEWFKSLRTARSIATLVSLWIEVGAAKMWLPELEQAGTSMPRPSPPLEERDPIILTALLCIQPGAVLRRLKASRVEIERASAMERGPSAPSGGDEGSIRAWLAAVGPAADDLSRLWSLRYGTAPPWAKGVAEIRRRGDPLRRSDLAITGSDLEALGATGPRVGQVLAQLLERVLDDPSLNSRDALLRLARELL